MIVIATLSAHVNHGINGRTTPQPHSAHLLLDGLCDGDASRFRRIKVRFSAPVFLGETLRIEAWADGEGRFQFEGRVEDRTVVSNAYFEFD